MFQRLKPISPLRFAFFSAACGLVAFLSFLLFGALIGDGLTGDRPSRLRQGEARGNVGYASASRSRRRWIYT